MGFGDLVMWNSPPIIGYIKFKIKEYYSKQILKLVNKICCICIIIHNISIGYKNRENVVLEYRPQSLYVA